MVTEQPETRVEEAMLYAAHAHRDQRRKATDIPYVSHLLSVAALVLRLAA